MSDILNSIGSNEDLKKLTIPELMSVAKELREFLVSSVSKTGGHLASNLGCVELTIALHKVFSPDNDRIIWDVGHQSYVHKILTGRKDKMSTLRQFGGMSGFPKRDESVCDAFNTGHSSTSASAALGIARARDLAKEDYNIISVFGDGALTGGMMYEAMNDAGHTKNKLIFILNDNEMSISENVGSLSRYLRDLRLKAGYNKSKEVVQGVFDKIPLVGSAISNGVRMVKDAVKYSVLPTTIFEDLGFEYMGPIDGHNIEKLIDVLQDAKKKTEPVLIHINTIKGKGYRPAESNPGLYHGVGKFDPVIGVELSGKEDYSAVMGKKLCEIASKNDKVVAICGAMREGTGLYPFAMNFSDRFFDVGIAEAHAVTLSAGLAVGGAVPVVALYSSFLQRAYDQLLHDVCLQNLHVVFCVDRAGLVGADGETHQGIFDLSYLSHMPNMTVLSPCNFTELCDMLEYAVNEHKGPVAIRYPRGAAEADVNHKFKIGKANLLQRGQDVSIVATGRMVGTALSVAENLSQYSISANVLELPTVFPLPKDDILSAADTKVLITIEDNVSGGGMGEAISALLLECDKHPSFKIFAMPNNSVTHGTVDELDKLCGVDADAITEYLRKECGR